MSFFRVEKEGASDRIVIALDSVEADFDTIDCGALNLVSILVKEAETKDAKGRTALHWACYQDHDRLAEWLIRKGAGITTLDVVS